MKKKNAKVFSFKKKITSLSRIILNGSINLICKINYPTQKIPVIKFMAKTKKILEIFPRLKYFRLNTFRHLCSSQVLNFWKFTQHNNQR